MAAIPLETPSFATIPAFRVAGLRENYTPATAHEIPLLWTRFAPHIGHVPFQFDNAAYGLVYNMHGTNGFDYVAGVAVIPGNPRDPMDGLPAEFVSIEVPQLYCVVFPHREHVSRLKDTIGAVFQEWLPASGKALAGFAAGVPGCIEYYGPDFDPATGCGEMDLRVPIQA